MFRSLLASKPFIGAVIFFLLIVGGSLLYMQHVKEQSAHELAEVLDRVRQWNEGQNQQPTAEAPVVEQPEDDGHFHEDETPVVQPIETPVAAPPEPDPLATVSEEERQRIIAQTLEYLPKTLELEKANRDLEKQIYEDALRQLKHFEEINAQRERNFVDTSRIKERIAEAKADLDMRESVIYHLEKWRDEHTKK